LAFDLTDRPAAAAVQASGDSSASSTDLHNLLQRMDAVLARDNQLI
jgi:hypothetical protein